MDCSGNRLHGESFPNSEVLGRENLTSLLRLTSQAVTSQPSTSRHFASMPSLIDAALSVCPSNWTLGRVHCSEFGVPMSVEDFSEEGSGVRLTGSIVLGKSLIEVADVLSGCLIVSACVEAPTFSLQYTENIQMNL